MKKNTTPLRDKKDIQKNSDHKIDEDFPGFPNGSATEKIRWAAARTAFG